jgi:hypothetical protein
VKGPKLRKHLVEAIRRRLAWLRIPEFDEQTARVHRPHGMIASEPGKTNRRTRGIDDFEGRGIPVVNPRVD